MATIWGLKVAVIPWGRRLKSIYVQYRNLSTLVVHLPIQPRNEGVPVSGCSGAIFKDIITHSFIPLHGCSCHCLSLARL